MLSKKMLGMRLTQLALVLVSATAMKLHAAQECTTWADFKSQAQTKMVTMEQPTLSSFDLQGRLIRRPLLSEEKFHWVGYQLYQSQAMVNKAVSQTLEYSVPFAVKIDNATGAIIKYHFNAKLKPADKNKLIGLHRALFLAQKPQDVVTSTYRITESDDLGLYQSEYNELNKHAIQRKKVRYLGAAHSGEAKVVSGLMEFQTAQVIADGFTFVKDKCWHEKVEGNSNISVVSSDGSLEINVQQMLLLQRSNKALPDDARLLSLPENPEDWQQIATDLVYPRPAPQPLKTQQAFLAALKKLDLLKGNRDDIMQFLYDNDKYLTGLIDLFASQSLADDVESKLFMCLGKHDTANAHRLLGDVYLREDLSPNQRFRSLMALRYSNNPLSPELVGDIFDYAAGVRDGENQTLSGTALMVMGAIAKNQKGSEFAEQLTQKIVNTMAESGSPQTTAALITALGNSGDAHHSNVLEAYLKTDNARLRSEAASALAKMPSETSLNMLSKQLLQEGDSKVKSSLLKAMGSNELTSQHLNTLYNYADTSQDVDVRNAAIDALTEQAKDNATVKTQLQELIKTEPNKHNLRKLMKAVYGS